MGTLSHAAQVALVILVVILIFNLIIFIHELGHYWAAKWRGLKIDRFQIWFGKPIWSKTINGVQYGLGWIPAGGFVALPQMAPMESIEGGNRDSAPLPPIKPLDKIIVAFAGPLFSFLLALLAALAVWVVGKPADKIPTTVVGSVFADGPAAKAGLQRGDKILEVNGHPVESWHGTLDSVFMRIATSEGEQIEFTVDRPGEGQKKLYSFFEIEPTKWWQRRSTRSVQMLPMGQRVVIEAISGENSPAEKSGLKVKDEVLAVNGIPAESTVQVTGLIREAGEKPVAFKVKRGEETLDIAVTPRVPVQVPQGESPRPMIGVGFDDDVVVDTTIVHPSPMQQLTESVRTMWVTITSVASPKSNIGIDQLSGPIGIAKVKFLMLLMDHPWERILAFMVLLNINLAILNMMPLPVLDGGHITLATMEAIAGRPVRAKVLEFVQVGFAMVLFSLMIYVTSKDIFDGVGRERSGKLVFPTN
ncbi:RIP metalloprotease RseP [Luteolibacter flavescens]|uniref:Zinc metalloprotease n=1 Tax=Luteolibacter flavescens TaxID=1859460 RepID=A0ABT3FL82_9BACT|nr:RIP metalloprotease RseP [Luteolibacter flavescens]MCW1884212.1 RIP metalloprotease RseP [Luteolibacter flavescens]